MSNKIIGYTTGVYDLFHIGHLNLLKKAKNECDYLIVGVSTDDLVKSYKGKTPVIPFEDRSEIIAALKCVDEVQPVTHRDKKKSFLDVGYDIFFVGDDWKGQEIFKDLEKYLNTFGSRVVYFSYTKRVSSTKFTSLLTNLSDNNE